MQETRPCDLWRFDMLQCFFWGGMVERMSQASGSNVVYCTSIGQLKWYLTCIYQRWEVLLERLNDHPSTDSTFLMLKFGLGNHSTCRDYHHYHYPNYCNLDQSRLGFRLKDPTGLQPEAV